MNTPLVQISPYDLKDNVFRLIDKEWFLITAGSMESFNTMTASWGGMGILWHKPVCFVFVRPTRHTFEFIDKADVFSLSFFHEKYRKILDLCGSVTGKKVDKIKETGLVPFQAEQGGIAFEQARMTMVCRKLYFDDLNPEHFLEKRIEKNYSIRDYHRMYIGEILSVVSAE